MICSLSSSAVEGRLGRPLIVRISKSFKIEFSIEKRENRSAV